MRYSLSASSQGKYSSGGLRDKPHYPEDNMKERWGDGRKVDHKNAQIKGGERGVGRTEEDREVKPKTNIPQANCF